MTIKPYVRKAQFHETDQMGIIHHANYIKWFEEARVDFMEQIHYGYDRATEAGIDFAVLSASCEYKSMTRFNDTVAVECRITSMEPSRMSVLYRVLDVATGELRATGETRHCFYSRIRKRPVALKKELPELYDLFKSLAGPNETESK
ncbi:acyl-CoA thioesterase [Gorillibacterium massiliense]|uniref:acyl-CoA thioesterase n=1 Tax=Gorillibacterium massiliense TaxID=1280390 RepID=UPI0004B9B3B3|nr:acyl-CoA thioesterase [Gorillibacterium massiliense]